MKRFSVVLLFLLSGCLVGPKFQKSPQKSPDAYRFRNESAAKDSIASLKWAEVYQDPVLQSLINQALKENRDLLMAVARIDQARAAAGMAKANILPEIGYAGSASVLNLSNSQANDNGISQRSTAYAVGTVSWEIDLWGKLRHGNRASVAELIATEESRKAIITNLVAEVASLYFQLRGLDQRLEIAKKTLGIRQEANKIITQRFKGGEVSEIDKFQAESQEAYAEALVPSIERQIAMTENALSVLVGRNAGNVDRGVENKVQQLPVVIPEGLPSQLLSQRMDVRQAEQLWIAQNERIGVAQAMRYPSISLTGALGIASVDLGTITSGGSSVWQVGGSIVGPLFSFGKNRRRVEIERAKTEQTRLQYEKTVLVAFKEVEDALVSVSTYKREYDARTKQVVALQGATRLSTEKYNSGFTNYLEVLLNEQSLLTVELESSLALERQLQSSVTLYKALGGGWQ